MNKVGKVFLNQASRKYKFFAQPIKAMFKSPYVAKITRYLKYYKHNKVKDNYILYQSRDGKSMTYSPYAVFLYLLSHK